MTTIAYRDGVMAADSGACIDDMFGGLVRKIGRAPTGELLGVCGNSIACAAVLSMFLEGKLEVGDFARDAVSGLVVSPTGKVFVVDAKGSKAPIENSYHAMGSGRIAAMGAMAAGASAEEAVRIACDLDVYSRGPVQVERLPRSKTAKEVLQTLGRQP